MRTKEPQWKHGYYRIVWTDRVERALLSCRKPGLLVTVPTGRKHEHWLQSALSGFLLVSLVLKASHGVHNAYSVFPFQKTTGLLSSHSVLAMRWKTGNHLLSPPFAVDKKTRPVYFKRKCSTSDFSPRRACCWSQHGMWCRMNTRTTLRKQQPLGPFSPVPQTQKLPDVFGTWSANSRACCRSQSQRTPWAWPWLEKVSTENRGSCKDEEFYYRPYFKRKEVSIAPIW